MTGLEIAALVSCLAACVAVATSAFLTTRGASMDAVEFCEEYIKLDESGYTPLFDTMTDLRRWHTERFELIHEFYKAGWIPHLLLAETRMALWHIRDRRKSELLSEAGDGA